MEAFRYFQQQLQVFTARLHMPPGGDRGSAVHAIQLEPIPLSLTSFNSHTPTPTSQHYISILNPALTIHFSDMDVKTCHPAFCPHVKTLYKGTTVTYTKQ